MDRQTDGPTKWGVESRSTRQRILQMILAFVAQSSNAKSEKREKLVADLRAENAELRSGVNEKSANDEVQAAAVDRLQRELLSLQQETEERDAREAEAEMERRKLEYLKTEAEMENEDLRRKLVGCENDVGRLKVGLGSFALQRSRPES